jgi:hypothetical protein
LLIDNWFYTFKLHHTATLNKFRDKTLPEQDTSIVTRRLSSVCAIVLEVSNN